MNMRKQARSVPEAKKDESRDSTMVKQRRRLSRVRKRRIGVNSI
jgi:hypothetical protein